MLRIKTLGMQPYSQTWEAMRAFTDARDEQTPDEIWFLEHPPVYTQGQAGKPEHILNATDIPIVQSDRGGQVTYHGPGQLVTYFLFDLKRRELSIRGLVCRLEKLIVAVLGEFDIHASIKDGAPGVYVNGQKIASIGLRVRKGCSYHGTALNIAMDLSPFKNINPCGYQALEMTQVTAHQPSASVEQVLEVFKRFCLDDFEKENLKHASVC